MKRLTETTQYYCYLDADTIEHINGVAEDIGISRSAFINKMIRRVIDEQISVDFGAYQHDIHSSQRKQVSFKIYDDLMFELSRMADRQGYSVPFIISAISYNYLEVAA